VIIKRSGSNPFLRMLNEIGDNVIVIDRTNGDLCLTGRLFENQEVE